MQIGYLRNVKISVLFVILCVAGLAGSAHGGIAHGAGTMTALNITVMPNGGKPTVGRRSYTLRCRPAGGTLPKPGTACSKLAKIQNPFAPVPTAMACTEIYGGPQEAVVVGLYDGKAVRTRFTRTDGCQIARWNRVRFLFPIPTGIR